MEFNNRPNIPHKIEGGGIVWGSRSVAVVGVVFLFDKDMNPYVLASKRGPNSADFQGKMNLVAGYLDWDESGTEALLRESWEETGLDIMYCIDKFNVLSNHLFQPWSVDTLPSANIQNVTLRYGLSLQMVNENDFPLLTVEHNEVEGEVENPQWLPLNEIHNYEWAFKHDMVIKSYLNYMKKSQ